MWIIRFNKKCSYYFIRIYKYSISIRNSLINFRYNKYNFHYYFIWIDFDLRWPIKILIIEQNNNLTMNLVPRGHMRYIVYTCVIVVQLKKYNIL